MPRRQEYLYGFQHLCQGSFDSVGNFAILSVDELQYLQRVHFIEPRADRVTLLGIRKALRQTSALLEDKPRLLPGVRQLERASLQRRSGSGW